MKALLPLASLLVFTSFCNASPVETVIDKTSVTRSNEMGLALVKSLHAQGKENIALSPISITSVFGLLQPGASGETLEQINKVFGDAYGLQKSYSRHIAGSHIVSSANLLAVEQSITLLPDYLKHVGNDNVRSADFRHAAKQERQILNQWVEKKTLGEIKNLLPSGTPSPQTLMIAVNAVAFDGKWSIEFDDGTQPGSFYKRGKVISVPMMKRENQLLFKQLDDGTLSISLPYKGEKSKEGDLSFVVIVSSQVSPLSDFLSGLDWKSVKKSIPEATEKKRKVILNMPRFSIRDSTIDLTDELKKTGLNDLFDFTKADLGKLSEIPSYLSAVYHQCCIQVGEKGTKATAATGFACDALCADFSPQPSVITINRPFFWMIYDNRAELVLFYGTVDTPEEFDPSSMEEGRS